MVVKKSCGNEKKKMDKNKIKKDWQQRHFSFDVWQDPPEQVWENFSHEVDELFMLAQGELELIINDKTYCPKVGEEILIPANALHTVKNIGRGDALWFYGYALLK